MKNYEKAYNEAIEKIRNGLQPLSDGTKISGVTRAFLEEVFPELKESEDEKIRKTLIELFSGVGKKDWRDIPTEKIIAWLEKQGEKKHTWSEEDEEYMSDVIAFLEDARECRQNALDCIEWMKQLKESLS